MKAHSEKKTGGELARRHEPSVFEQLPLRMNRLFDGFFDEFDMERAFPAWTGLAASSFNPKFELSETETEIQLSAELPGMEEKDVSVSLEDGLLTISGEKRQEKEEKGKNRHYSEISYGSFSRSFGMPSGLDADKAKAKFSKGVLKVCVPKTEEAKRKQRKIEVKAE